MRYGLKSFIALLITESPVVGTSNRKIFDVHHLCNMAASFLHDFGALCGLWGNLTMNCHLLGNLWFGLYKQSVQCLASSM